MIADDAAWLGARVRDAVLHEWDPIGVQQFAEAQDEYDSYVPQLCELLRRGVPEGELVSYLWSLETEHMGLNGDLRRTEAFARRLREIANCP